MNKYKLIILVKEQLKYIQEQFELLKNVKWLKENRGVAPYTTATDLYKLEELEAKIVKEIFDLINEYLKNSSK